MKILCIGDIVGRPGRECLGRLLPELRGLLDIDIVIANAENASGGSGILPKHADAIFKMGVDAITLGDHVWDKREIYAYLDENQRIARPANFPTGSPGRGFLLVPTPYGVNIGIVNLIGRTFMRYPVNCPFRAFDEIYQNISTQAQIIVVDMHAETTSEKIAFSHYVDGRATVVFGTHTHVQTADERISEKGTGSITDLGMTGPIDSVIGQNKEKIIERFLTSMPQKFEVAANLARLSGIVVTVDNATHKTMSINRLNIGDIHELERT